jgi:hypothetical protein
MAKIVWMAHLEADQATLWQTALASQQMQVICKSAEHDLKEELEEAYTNPINLPHLVLLDVGIKSPNSETLQSGNVCQWAVQKDNAPKIVLVNPRQEKIKDLERAWALRRGASDMLPRLSAENLIELVSTVTELIGRPCVADLLHSAMRQNIAIAAPTVEPATAKFIDDQPSAQIRSAIKNSDTELSKDKAKYVIYRGVRVRR